GGAFGVLRPGAAFSALESENMSLSSNESFAKCKDGKAGPGPRTPQASPISRYLIVFNRLLFAQASLNYNHGWISEYKAHADLKLARAAEGGSRRRSERLARQWESCRRSHHRQAVSRVAEDADRIYAEVLVRRARHVEGLRCENQPPRFAQAERFEQTQIEIEKIWLAQAVAPGHAAS